MTVMPSDFDEHPSPNAKAIILARWREKVIRPALDHPRGSRERKEAVERLAAIERDFPNGRTGRVAQQTAYNWIKAFEAQGLKGLIRKARSDRLEYRVYVNREWDKFFASRIPPALAEHIREELDEAIHDFWEEIDATWRMVCLNSTEWLLYRTTALKVEAFETLPLGSIADGSGGDSQYGLCSINRRRAMRDR